MPTVLWKRADIDAARVAQDLRRVVVAINPPGEDTDETGTIGLARRRGGPFVLENRSGAEIH